MTNPLTTATSVGVAIRYSIAIVSSVLTIVSILGWLTPEQVAGIVEKVRLITAQVPELLTAGAGLVAILTPVYAMVTKATSDKASAAAKEIDKRLPVDSPVVIQTPAGRADIVIPATKA